MWDNSPAFGGFDDEAWCNGNTTDFDSVIVGSNPAVSGGKINYCFMVLLSDFFGGSERREVAAG